MLCWCLTSGCLYGMVLHERIVRYCGHGLAGTFSLIVRYCDGIAGGSTVSLIVRYCAGIAGVAPSHPTDNYAVKEVESSSRPPPCVNCSPMLDVDDPLQRLHFISF